MKTGARNQFFGKVSKISGDTMNVELIVALKGDETLVATITKKSAESLGIKTGSEIVSFN